MGRFCLNCGHLIGAPVPSAPVTVTELPAVEPPAVEPRWNPDDDLLPYDDHLSEPGDSGLRGLLWLGWVVGAALLVALVLVLLRVFGVDGSDGDEQSGTEPVSSQADESAQAEAPPKGIGRASNVARAASVAVPSTAPATTDFDGQLVAYEAAQMHDGVPATTWRMGGDGTDEVITITLPRPTVVSRVGLINGYAKQVSGVNWYPHNRRILSAQWGFDDGTTVEQTFAERPDVQQMKVPAVVTSTVTLTISSVSPPGAGTLGRDYTAISEVAITGRRAR